MKNLTTLAAVAALALGFAVNDAAAHHGKGSHVGGSGSGAFQNTVEAPFLENNEECLNSLDTGMCDNSIGKIGSGGSYKVHIKGVEHTGSADEYWQLCIDDLTFFGGSPEDIDEVVLTAKGDLNFSGNLIDDVVGTSDRLDAPFLLITRAGASQTDCDGDLGFIQGLTFPSP